MSGEEVVKKLREAPRKAVPRIINEALKEIGHGLKLDDILGMDEPERTLMIQALAKNYPGQTYWLAPSEGAVKVSFGAPHERHYREIVIDGPSPFVLREAVYLLDFYGPRSEKPLLEEVDPADLTVSRKKGK